jgi:hypothetical protein
MNHPVLHIKKGAIIYDDRDAQRASEIPRPALPGSGPFVSRRRRRRRGPYTFIPLLVVAMGLFIIFRVIPNTPVSRAVLSGWQATLHVTPYKNRLIVGVTFVSRAQIVDGASSASPVSVRIFQPDSGTRIQVEGVLEKSPMTLRGELVRTSASKIVEAEVNIREAHTRLWLPVP